MPPGDQPMNVIQEGKIDCQVAMVTAVRSNFATVVLPIDAYLTNPVFYGDLLHVVVELLFRTESPPDEQETCTHLTKDHAGGGDTSKGTGDKKEICTTQAIN